MKKTAVIICILLLVLNGRTQDYLIDFAGSGDTRLRIISKPSKSIFREDNNSFFDQQKLKEYSYLCF